MTVSELATILGVELTVKLNASGNWTASLGNCECKEHAGSAILSGAVGFGPTPTFALCSLAAQIKGKHLVIDAFGVRREFQIPMSLEA